MQTDDFINTVESLSILKHLSERERKLVSAHSKKLFFLPLQPILKQNDISPGIFLILAGEANGFVKILGEGDKQIETYAAGDFIGESSLISNKICNSTILAETSVTCLYIPARYLETLAEILPELYFKIIKSLAEILCQKLIKKYLKVSSIIKKSHIKNRYYNFLLKIKSYRKLKKHTVTKADISLEELKLTPFFETFTQEEFAQFLKLSTFMHGKKNCLIMNEGSKKTTYFLILKGAVQSRIISHKHFIKISVLGPLSFFGSMSWLVDQGSIVSYITCEHSLILKIDLNDLKNLKQTDENLWHKINNLIFKSFFWINYSFDKAYIRLNNEPYREDL